MKVAPEHLAELRTLIAPLDNDERRQCYRARDIPRGELVQDIDKRYRWDLYWLINAMGYRLLGDYNDAHIDTALRNIVAPL